LSATAFNEKIVQETVARRHLFNPIATPAGFEPAGEGGAGEGAL